MIVRLIWSQAISRPSKIAKLFYARSNYSNHPLRDVLQIPRIASEDSGELFVVIVHLGEFRAGIIVDNLIGQQEIAIKSLGKLLAGIKVIAGATILGNGQGLVLILDIGS